MDAEGPDSASDPCRICRIPIRDVPIVFFWKRPTLLSVWDARRVTERERCLFRTPIGKLPEDEAQEKVFYPFRGPGHCNIINIT